MTNAVFKHFAKTIVEFLKSETRRVKIDGDPKPCLFQNYFFYFEFNKFIVINLQVDLDSPLRSESSKETQ